MELKQLTIQTLAKFLGKSPESVSELLFKKSDDGTGLTDELNEDAMAQLEAIHADHIKGTGAEALDAKYNEGHKAGKFEALSKAEDELRKQFGVEGKTLKDVTAAIAAKAAQEAGRENRQRVDRHVGIVIRAFHTVIGREDALALASRQHFPEQRNIAQHGVERI